MHQIPHDQAFKSREGESSAGSKGSEWEVWGRDLLRNTLESAPLDFGQVWGVALRYGLHWLAKRSPQGFESLLDLICKPVSAGKGGNNAWPILMRRFPFFGDGHEEGQLGKREEGCPEPQKSPGIYGGEGRACYVPEIRPSRTTDSCSPPPLPRVTNPAATEGRSEDGSVLPGRLQLTLR